ncbi:hypothetical protein GPECTOR_152g54 [Gonium pectorale]|uniref:glycerophosphodiester phosphodiesterase n=1 Tax=Gonium pectorale TaxID=33097 RepID=A0A150FXR7_GONPE|nr:hypothetical protein GPECTOR_152g54 [Gonium pectorale]|eukprot:KXZ42399.1 hypothetical protein GPECTOR_152g54 [Gonium pectorale]
MPDALPSVRFRPEHTLASYELAIQMGADFIECDVVLTKDLVPVCRHEPLVSATTDADAKFPEKNTTYVIDGTPYTGVFTVDLTLAELKMLRARQQLPERDQSYNGMYEVPTLEEYIMLAKHANRVVGIYPETKHPTWHDNLAIVKEAKTTISDIVLNLLKKHGYKGPINSPAWARRPAFIQSFEVNNLKYLATKTCIPLIQLMDDFDTEVPDVPGTTYSDLMTDQSLARIAAYASGVGPWKNTLMIKKANATDVRNGAGLMSSGLAERIHKFGMQLHPYTWRDEAYRLAYGNFSTPYDEYELFFVKLGIDGCFTDFAATLSSWLKIKDMEAGRQWNTHLINRPGKAKAANPKC